MLHKTEDLISLNPQIVNTNKQPHDKKLQKLIIAFTVCSNQRALHKKAISFASFYDILTFS